MKKTLEVTRRDFIKVGAATLALLCLPAVTDAKAEEYLSSLPKFPENPDKEIYYCCHIKNYGWTEWCTDGATCGSTEEKRPIDAIAIKLKKGIPSYEAYLQGFTWTDWYGDGDVCGIVDGGNPIGALKVTVPKKNVIYRGHFYGGGWTEWYKNGKTCGKSGDTRVLNAIQIKLMI